MIRVYQLDRGIYRLEVQGDMLEMIELLADVKKYDAEQVLALLLYSVLRIDSNNVLVERAKNGLER